MESRPGRARLILIVGLAAALALGVGLRAVYSVRHADDLEGDARVYDRLARQLVSQGYLGYGPERMRSWRPPLYPAFVAGIYRLAVPDPLAVKLVQSLVAGITILIVFLIGRRLHSDPAGIAGAVLLALCAFEIRHPSTLYPETLLALLVAAFALLALGEPSVPRVLAHALLAGLALHLQPGLASLVAFWTAWIAIRRWGIRSLGLAVLFLLSVGACLLPWTIRNHAVHDRLVFVSTNGGFNLMKGNNPEATSLPAPGAYIESVKSEMPGGLDEIGRDRWYRHRALSWISGDPDAYLVLCLARLLRWGVPRHLVEPASGWPVTFGLIFPLAVLGAAVLVRRRERLGRLLVVVAAIAAPAVLVVFVGPRYRTPAMPLFSTLAGIGLAALVGFVVTRVRSRRSRRSSPPRAPRSGRAAGP